MSTSGRGELRVGVRIGAGVWAEEIERYGQGSAARVAAERERPALERVGIGLSTLMPCDPEGPDGTRLGGLVKA